MSRSSTSKVATSSRSRSASSPASAPSAALRSTGALPELDRLGAFVAVVEANGFTAAARVAGMRKGTLSRQVRELEERLGVALLRRTSRAIALTAEGQAYLAPARAALEAARTAEAAVAASRGGLAGVLRVTTTPVLAELLVESVLAPYLQAHPDVALELDDSPRATDPVSERFDLAIRAGRPRDSSLRARRLGGARITYVASPAYVRRCGAPASPAELAQHSALVVDGGEPPWWAFVDARRQLLRQPITPRLSTPSNQVVLLAARAGIGIARMADFYVARELAERRLVPVLEAWTPPVTPIYALRPAGRMAPRTRAFLELLVTQLATSPALLGQVPDGPAQRRTARQRRASR